LTTPPFFGTSTRSSEAGKPRDTFFCMKPFAPIPDGKRSIVTGRPLMCGTITSATAS
jgi:hypothetical protein